MNSGFFSPLSAIFKISDEQAMWRVQTQDDGQAFALLMQRWQSPIERLCARMTGSVDTAQDLAQETFARLYGCRKKYQPEGKFSSFLWRIAVNLCYDDLRRAQRRRETSLDELESDKVMAFDDRVVSTPTPGEEMQELERADQVRRALLRLPEVYRCVIILRHYEDLKFREIAEALEIPEGTVKSRMAEGLSQLHKFLTPSFDSAPPKTKNQREMILL